MPFDKSKWPELVASAERDRISREAKERAGCGQCLNCLEGKTQRIGGIDWPLSSLRMVVCATCGDKRCPHAADCSLECKGGSA